ncbi:TPA: hypothetical protein ACJFYZ_000957 [Salmonella enterica subsp. enterica]|nr:hypothetical protein [Salmonella enterica subsp. enterica]EHI1800785.1 hypothetical protein [Salmonella enterica]HAK5455497.1 hypothetical protein [Salmonella enterica]HAK5458867.1 hypothetical protein [Salmonella enterica]HCZ2197251.1 hypothetical protein [Salmonella enterica subsp. enterica]
MYLAWALPLLFPFCAKLAQKRGFQALNPIIFAFLRNPLKFAALVAPDNGNDHSQEGDKLLSL